jgi:hypothetical protein
VNIYRTIPAILTALCLVSCATVERGTLLGASIGAGAGVAVSTAQSRSEGKAIAIATGALIGGVIGYFATKEKIQTEQSKRTEPLLNFAPKIKRPEVRKVWVPDQITGDEYVSGHWKFVIDRPAVWSKED